MFVRYTAPPPGERGRTATATCDACGREFTRKLSANPNDGGWFLEQLDLHMVAEHGAERCEQVSARGTRCCKGLGHATACEAREGWSTVSVW